MGEITMPAELLAAVNIMGGGAAGAAGMQAVPEEGSAMFGSILSKLMSGTAETEAVVESQAMTGTAEESAEVPTAAVPAGEDIPEAEDVSAEDALLAAMDGDENAELPKEFTPEGAEVFLKTLDRLLDGKCSPEDIGNLWREIPDGEKASYVKLLETIFSGGGVRISSVNAKDDKKGSEGGKDFLITLAELTAKTAAKKSEKKSGDDPTGMTELIRSAFITSIITMKTADVEAVMTEALETAQTEAVSAAGETAEAVYVQAGETQIIPDRADVSMTVEAEVSNKTAAEAVQAEVPAEKASETAESAEQGKAVDAEDNLDEIIQSVYSKLSETDSDKAAELCRALADGLKAQISESGENKADAMGATVLESDRQAFMARVNRQGEMQIPQAVQESTAAAPTAQVHEITAENTDIADTDITAQIMERIDLYRDIADSGFTGREITMKLKPEELGGLEIKIRRSGGGLSISFAAEKAEAAGLIAERAAQLAEAVASRGVKLREVYVSEQIVTEKGSSEFYQGGDHRSGNGAYEGTSDRSGDSSGRRFTFGPEGMSEDTDSIDGTDGISAAGTAEYYNKEARLWVSA